jgi:hypothetical protein
MIDFGSSGSQGPFLTWQARASIDGEMPAKSFVLRSQDGKAVVDNLKKGVVIDIDALKLGWCRSDGVAGQAPEWRWNASVARFEPSPGDGWKRGFSMPVALNKDDVCVWEQSQAGAFSALQNLFGGMAKTPGWGRPNPGMLPVVRHVGETKIESKRGMTFSPILEIVKWVPRPECLGGGAPSFAETPAAHVTQKQPEKSPADADPVPF